ncbi:MAG: FAD-dependent oxidoreductase [Cyanobacteria bacterium J06621_8]
MAKVDRSNDIWDCIVIGGGMTGLVTATILQRQGYTVTVLDKGRGIGGRLATRRVTSGDREGVFDYGTQYFSVKDQRFKVWVDEWLSNQVVKVWCDGFGKPDGKPRYCGVNGTRTIAKYLAKDLEVQGNTRVTEINYNGQWLVKTSERQYQSKNLVLTPPVPQSLDLLDTSSLVLPKAVRSDLEEIRYFSCLAVLALLEQPSKIPEPGGIALEDESLVWLGDNQQKGISPNGYAVTLHGNPKFSEAHWQSDDELIAQKLLTAASQYLGSPAITYQVHRWRYSLPRTFYPEPCLHLPQFSLALGGDAFVSPKLEGAVISGLAAGESISKHLAGKT